MISIPLINATSGRTMNFDGWYVVAANAMLAASAIASSACISLGFVAIPTTTLQPD